MRRFFVIGLPLLALAAACSQSSDKTADGNTATPAEDTSMSDPMSDTAGTPATDGSATGTMAAPQDPNQTGPETTPPAPGQSSAGQTSMGQTKGEPASDKGNTTPPPGQ